MEKDRRGKDWSKDVSVGEREERTGNKGEGRKNGGNVTKKRKEMEVREE